jgi:hypothetical protein
LPALSAVFAADIIKIALLSPEAKNPFRFFVVEPVVESAATVAIVACAVFLLSGCIGEKHTFRYRLTLFQRRVSDHE